MFIHDLLKSLNIFATMDEEKIAPEPLSHKSFRYIYRNTKTDKPFEKWVEEYRKELVPRKDYELNPITMPNSGVTMVDWVLL